MFFMLFFTLDLAFLMLACAEYAKSNGAAGSAVMLTQAGGGFGLLAAFLGWYNAFAGIADSRYAPNYVCPRRRITTNIIAAIPSSSSPSSTSPGLRRDASSVPPRANVRQHKFVMERLRAVLDGNILLVCVKRVILCEN